MKFSNGNWLNKEGYKLEHPMELYDVEKKERSLTVYAPFTPIIHRGKTLDGGMMTVELSSPLEDVICVKLSHHSGGIERGPHFELHKEDVPVEIEENEEKLFFSSGNLHAAFHKKGDWKLEFYNEEKQLASSRDMGMSYIVTDQKEVFMREQLSLDVGELIYGLGERFTSFVKNGQTVDIWNEDGGTGSEQAYKNIPFYLSNKGYGVFVNHPERVSFEVGSEKVSKVQFSVEGESLEYYIINGPEPKQVLEKYTVLTGKPSLPPAWTFGLWLSTSFTTNYDEETVTKFINGMEERDIPLDVFHFDCFWMKEFEWCNFLWDDRVFPEPEKMLMRLKEKGLKICLWINPYIAQKSPLFKEASEKGYLLKKTDGSVWQWDKWQAGLGIVDFTNPEASSWFEHKLAGLIDMGVDSFKTDFGERIPTDVCYYDGSDPKKMHNYYAYLYNKVVFDLLEKKAGKGQAALFARSASVGSQKLPVHWGGDCWGTYPSMAESLRGGLSFGLSGFSFWSHDIAGFEQGATPDLYKRWTQFGLLSSHSRYHGNTEYKVPWLYDEEAVDVTRVFTKLKNTLMPYLYRIACESTLTGVPMMRAMVLEFIEDETCHYLDRQYMLGDSLLAAPIFNDQGIVKYYLPKGKWTNFLTNQVVEGEKWHTEEHGYLTLPLMAKENSIIAVGSVESTADYDYLSDVTFHVFELAAGSLISTDLYSNTGIKTGWAEAKREGNTIVFKVSETVKNYSVLLRNITEASVSSGITEVTNDGIVLKAEENIVEITL
ncbi:alpha-xylosidase [Peribacillus psychrosaccharolyticus]|uniref:alpha-D-xyloside xylohydrolase n=1 Tax=Peribacillus psychrosaccharolyticus TaxID=1407 RepID=A0A974NMJ8_PERPY|nr:alpha-xylosidase [Peribacillus psychrosaccharolyticus]MEC2056406.1 alpha-xylosidase [Peribacillus psychrosaccharolyticus]MED3743808.1 alpha-xylosidase [Peribacillus psychrosaccharolyticus]QQT00434.1 alpha-xylosidase [Peribacillus psychrosaccharolyticus]